jgi:hypothetical protein
MLRQVGRNSRRSFQIEADQLVRQCGHHHGRNPAHRIDNATGRLGALQVRWNDAAINAVASVTGKIQGATLIAERIAP